MPSEDLHGHVEMVRVRDACPVPELWIPDCAFSFGFSSIALCPRMCFSFRVFSNSSGGTAPTMPSENLHGHVETMKFRDAVRKLWIPYCAFFLRVSFGMPPGPRLTMFVPVAFHPPSGALLATAPSKNPQWYVEAGPA